MLRKTLLILFGAAGVAWGASSTETATSTGSASLGSLEVTGEARDKVLIEKVTPTIQVNPRDLVDPMTDKTEKLLERTRALPSEADFARFDRLTSAQTARPWLPDLTEPPLIRFTPEPARAAVASWRLEVTDDRGDVIQTLTGKGQPVKDVIWDGWDARGRMVKVASAYGFRFITVDEFKNTHTTLGSSLEFKTLKYQDKKNLYVDVASNYLFSDAQVAAPAAGIMERLVDEVRAHSSQTFTVELHSTNPESELSRRRVQGVANKIAKDLVWNEESVKYRLLPVSDRGEVLRLVIRLN